MRVVCIQGGKTCYEFQACFAVKRRILCHAFGFLRRRHFLLKEDLVCRALLELSFLLAAQKKEHIYGFKWKWRCKQQVQRKKKKRKASKKHTLKHYMDVLVDNIELGRGGGDFLPFICKRSTNVFDSKKKKRKREFREEKKKKKEETGLQSKNALLRSFFLQNRSKNNIEEAG